MDIELVGLPQATKYHIWKEFLFRAGLEPDEIISQTVLVWDDGTLIAAGSRYENILKCIAVDSSRRGEDLTATVLTHLRQSAFQEGWRHLFLYTKPVNRYLFSSLFFYPVAGTDKVLLMEDKRRGILDFLESLPPDRDCAYGGCASAHASDASASSADTDGQPERNIGAVIMNCNPFTLGHQYLIETAAKECDRLYVFVLSEDKSYFSAADRLNMVRLGTSAFSNVTVLPTGPYLISSATFPTYFIKEREQAEQIHCQLDIEIFTRYFVPHFHITRRYVGSEPLSPMTNQYNEALKLHLPPKGILLKELPRLEKGGLPVSASTVRALIKTGNTDAVRNLVPQTTFDYLQAKGLL